MNAGRIKRHCGKPIVYIISNQKFQSELLALYLHWETGLACIIKSSSDLNFRISEKEKNRTVILLDGSGKDSADLWSDLVIRTNGRRSNCCLALFNVRKDQNVEFEAIRQGIRGVFFENSDASLLAKGVKAILRGEYWFSRECMVSFLKKGNRPGKTQLCEAELLTQRENNVLLHIASGKSAGQIAETLFISRYTVKTHTRNIYKKLGVKNRFEALRWAARHI